MLGSFAGLRPEDHADPVLVLRQLSRHVRRAADAGRELREAERVALVQGGEPLVGDELGLARADERDGQRVGLLAGHGVRGSAGVDEVALTGAGPHVEGVPAGQ